MTHVLTVEAGETHTVTAGTTETYSSANIDGNLDVQGHLQIQAGVVHEEPEEADVPIQIDFPTQIDIPSTFNLNTMAITTGPSIFIIGIMAVTLTAAWMLRNWAAGLLWGIAFVTLIVGSLMGMSLEVFWMSIVAVIILLMAGMVVRWVARPA